MRQLPMAGGQRENSRNPLLAGRGRHYVFRANTAETAFGEPVAKLLLTD